MYLNLNISAHKVTLLEHTPPGSAVVTVTATDRDSGENGKITYRVMSSTQEGFYIDPNNGNRGLSFLIEQSSNFKRKKFVIRYLLKVTT